MLGIGINKRVFATFLSTALLFDCIFVNLKYDAEYRVLFSLFKPKFYHEVSAQTTKQNNPCAIRDTCKRLKIDYTYKRCYCDQECKEYNDCCFDANFNDTAPRMKSQHLSKQLLTCETKAFRNRFFGVLVVSKCPVDYQFADISEKCSLEENIHPVSADDGTTFRNVYCAYCHNVHQYNEWRFTYMYGHKCVEKYMDLLTTIPNKIRHIIENDCKYQFVPPSTAKVRSCLKDVISTDADTGLCSEFRSPILIDNQLYRNVYCTNASFAFDRCIPSYMTVAFEGRNFAGLSLLGIFNIRPLFEILGQKNCKGNFHYDSTKKNLVRSNFPSYETGCKASRSIGDALIINPCWCAHIHAPDACIRNNCIDGQEEKCDAELIVNYVWEKALTFVTDDITDTSFSLRLVSIFYLSLPVESYQMTMKRITGHYGCGRNENNTLKSCCVGLVGMVVSNGIEMSLEATRRFMSDIRNIKWAYTERRTETNVSAYDASENSNLTDTCNVSENKKFRYTDAPFQSLLGRIVINKTWTPPTEIPTHLEGVLVISNDNGSLPELRLEKLSLKFEGKNENNQTRPTTTSTPGPNVTSDWSVGTILTYTTLSISCCFLILTLSTYSYFDLFQSPSGVISKYMMATMLAAQLVFIVGVGASYVTVVCTAVGIISHYLWLTSFTWISIFLFSILNMMRTLYKSPGALTKEQKQSKVVYCFGFGLPFLVVLPCALLDVFSEVDIGYSKGNICFPTGFMANLFSFTLPVLITLCFNVVTLVITSVSISRYNNTVLLLQTVRQVRSFIPIYLRLCIFCACPWILGIIADIVQLDPLRYIYIILAGSHGTFVGISFLLAKSVRSRVRCSRSKKPTNE